MRDIRVLCLGLVAVGCYAYRPASRTPQPEAQVRIVFVSASAIAVRTSPTDSVPRICPGVLEATGRVVASAADTVVLRLGTLRTSGGEIAGVADRLAFIPNDRVASISERRFESGRTALTGLGVLTLTASSLIIVLIVVLTRAASG
jgi:hypothetical protein